MTGRRVEQGTRRRADRPAAAFALAAFIIVLLAQMLPHGPRQGGDGFAVLLAAHVCGGAEWRQGDPGPASPGPAGQPEGSDIRPCPVCTLAKALVLPTPATLPRQAAALGTGPTWASLATEPTSSPAALPLQPRAPPVPDIL